MPDPILVLVIEVRALDAADGDLWELMVRDPYTGSDGLLVLPEDEFRALCGDCPTQDLIPVDRAAVAWKTIEA